MAVNKKTGLWVLALVVGLALLGAAGCGGDGEEAATTTTETAVAPQPGGTAKFNLKSDTDYTDPALAYYQVSWQFLHATCAKLLNYPDKPVPEGSQLQPEVAEGMPEVSADGKTYTFTIRSGFKFSPPSTEEVTAETFKFVIERNLHPKMASPAASFSKDIVGATEFNEGKAKSVSGVTVDGNKLTIKLTQVAPDFLSRIAMPFFCAIPLGTPVNPKGEELVPMAGPYYITKRIPSRTFELARNPNYTGDRPALLDKVTYTVGVDENQGILQIEKGQADYAADALPPAAHSRLNDEYGADSEPGKAGKQQYFVNPALIFSYFALNTTRPIFKDVATRQAVNFAIDRPAISRQSGAFAGSLTDQYLPPGVEGFRDAEIYPLDAPDVDRANELMGGKKGTAVIYTCNAGSCPKRAQVVQANLAEIGIDVEIKQWERAVQFQKEGTKGEPFDIADEGWIADYPDPFDFINILLDGTNITAQNNVNFSYFADPAYIEKMHAAAQLDGDERFSTYGDLDIDLATNAAPLASYQNDNNRDFFSARIGCQVYQPIYGMIINTLCITQ